MRAPFLDALGGPTRVERLKAGVPWFVKVGAKLVLSRLPVSYRSWSRLNLFRFGEMLDPRYAVEVYRWHYERVRSLLPPDYAVVELGPGDSLATALVCRAFGARRSVLVDAGEFAELDVEPYRRLHAHLESMGMASGVDLDGCETTARLLNCAASAYLTAGTASVRLLPEESIDFVFSQHVLEHVRRGEFDDLIAGLLRVMKRGAVGSHSVDFEDHMGGSLNSLRFAPETWESERFANAGFYTNRLRASEVLRAFAGAGYDLIDVVEYRWSTLPFDRSKLHPAFDSFTDDDLCIRGLDVLVRRP